ncbi:MAG: thioredoxin family protein [Enterobacteriaceae bacterium]
MIELNKENFAAETGTGKAVVDFWGENCDRCMELMPDIQRLAKAYGDQLTFCSLNIQGNRRLAMEQKVMGLPSIVFYHNGERVKHLSGESLQVEEIEQAIQAFCSES